MKKKLLSLALAAVMTVSLAACGGGSGSGSSGSGSGTLVTIFNSKSEIQDQFEELANTYSDTHEGVDIEVYYSNDTVSAHMATKYASNDPYVISMVDAKDVYSLGAEHALDLSDQDWVSHTEYAISVDDKVIGFPFCIEARGVMYNKDAIKNITGKDFDPASCATLDGFKAVLEELKAGGMEAPVGIMKEDWSLAAHYFQEIYEEQDDPEAFVQSLYAGTADLANNAVFNAKMDTFDTLMAYNYAAKSPVAAERETSEQKLAEGEIAFMFGGNWDWSLIKDYNEEANLGMMPVPQNTDSDANTKLVGGGSKYFFIDSSDNISEEQVAAAKDFLNWLVSDPDGNAFLTEKCAVVPAYDNIDASALDPLSISVKEYADKGAMIDNYNYDPDDHYSVVGASMQKYLAGEIDRAGFAAEVEKYWSSTTPVEH
ncbi:MAG: carbohydrate ABC transporter substrate-binding protein [Eubacterium sp.]|nr:carbohydrate ABC transporter substrate-binding protein [Eubacterium sp.]